MKGVERTVEEARAAVHDEPKRWKAALTYEHAAPQTRDATVRLYATIKGAEEDMRELWKQAEEDGWKRVSGGYSHGIIRATKDGVWYVIALQKRAV